MTSFSWRAWALFGVVAALAGVCARPAGAAVVISQVYGGGGNSDARFRHDFIELYNAGPDAVDVTGWSVRYVSANGAFPATVTAANTTSLSGVIAPGRYYLVQEAAGSGGALELPAPDVVGAMGLSSGNGKIALVRHAAPLPADASPPDAALVDFAGYGAASAYEGSGPAPAPSGTTAIQRMGQPRGAMDTDDNAMDFGVGPPDPRNGAFEGAPAVRSVICAPGAVNPGAGALLIAEVAPGFSPVQSVTVNLAPLNGGSALPLVFNPSTSRYQALLAVPVNAPPGIHLLTVTATDTQARAGSGVGPLTINGGAPLSVRAARIAPLGSTFAVRGVVTAIRSGNPALQDPDTVADPGGLVLSDGTSRDGIPTLQPGQDAVVTGHLEMEQGERVMILSGPSDITVKAEGQPLPAAKSLFVPETADETQQGRLVRVSGLTVVTPPGTISAPPRGELASLVAEDALGNRIRVALHRNTTAGATMPYPGPPSRPVPALVGSDGTIAFTDIQAGDIYTVTGVLGVWPGGEMNVLRVRDADDFQRTQAHLIVSATAAPPIAEQGGTATLSVVTNPATGCVVLANLHALGGSTMQPLAFNGTGYALTIAIPSDASLGSLGIPVQAYHASGMGEGTIRLSIVSPLFDGLSIAQLRDAPDGTQARVAGIVTARTVGPAGTYYIQDATGGIRIVTNGPDPGYNVGDELTVKGVRDTLQGGAALDASPAPLGLGSFALSGFGKPVPSPAAVTAAGWPSIVGRLGHTTSLVVLGAVNATGGDAYVVTDGTAIGELFLADRAGFTDADKPGPGAALNVTGVVDAFESGARDTFQIRPRSPSDVSPGTAPAQVPVALAFATQPKGGWPGQRLAIQPVVVARSADSRVVTPFRGTVKISILSGTGPDRATLSGTRSVTAAEGVAAFTDLTLNKAGTGYVLVAESGGLSVQSAPFAIGATVTAGDVDGDGSVTMADVRLALKIAAGLLDTAASGVSAANADLNGDGAISLDEAARIRRLMP